MVESHNKRTVVVLIIILAVIWGSSFILIKRGLDVYTPVQVGAIRIFVAFLCVFPFVFRSFNKVEPGMWKYLFATGLLGNGIPAILFPLAGTNISSAVSGMMNSATPIFTLIIGMSMFGMAGGRNRILGLLLGLVGALILVGGKSGTLEGGDPMYAGYIVIATICYAFSVNILRYKLPTLGSMETTGFALLFAAVPLGIYLFTTDFVERTQITEGAFASLSAILVLGILSTALSTVLFNRLIKISGALSASSVTYLIPIVAIAWGYFDNENVGFLHLGGLIAILGGVYLINKKG
ncbi:MAG: DMT family transporter [Bacteroidia bacterium]|nr:DMT family transporter [Bacteroidia bacterium]